VTHVGYDAAEIGAAIAAQLAHGRYEPSHIYFKDERQRDDRRSARDDAALHAEAFHDRKLRPSGIGNHHEKSRHHYRPRRIQGHSRQEPQAAGGKPLLAYTIEPRNDTRARSRDPVDRGSEIAEAARRSAASAVHAARGTGARRNAAPAGDSARAQWMIDHGYQPDAVVILQPTSPLRIGGDIAARCACSNSSGADSW
jgi:hypothetical protein